MTYSDTVGLGCFAVLGASAFMVLRPKWFFVRKLSLEEALTFCWVVWSIYMGAFVVYIGLKLPLGLSRDAHGLAVGVAVCSSIVAGLWLARVTTDWKSAGTDQFLVCLFSHLWWFPLLLPWRCLEIESSFEQQTASLLQLAPKAGFNRSAQQFGSVTSVMAQRSMLHSR
ncbi:hypothetical protein [Bradyrhizobium valentinum]|uniref:Uncharacterized protein n=1 Tax=Bradyrhizobium valentinum TaxID=1518501 RepID=A0A0R3LGH9_9BRAD|nr:hypothetical protein [Bradyrhizobium valentinum]KRQ99480.1 hypothetical protein CQ10_25190 [Bradyrhizobium valentinum]KRR06866.1 hypothetical protein CP49_01825 [Bradyrhizobium valentinum]